MPKDINPTFPIEFIQIPTTNYRVGRNGMLPDCIVIHNGEGTRQAIINTFYNPASQVSSHFLVCRDGAVVQFVSTNNAAFCNGRVDNPINELTLQRKENPNDWTISIEHEAERDTDLTDVQYQASANLIKFLCEKWGVAKDRTHIFGHREIYSLKVCPGIISTDKLVQMARK